RRPRVILDATRRVIVVLCGHPHDPAWGAKMRRAAEIIRRYKARCKFDAAHSYHRRGEYETLGWGLSFGGGRVQPGWIDNTACNQQAMAELLQEDIFQEMIGFADSQFAQYFPSIHDDFQDTLERVVADDPRLSYPIPGCAWAAAHVNFPPGSWTRAHTDHLNHVGGLCGVWALDDFDPDKGGHLILWDLRLIIRFPPGNFILLPSALIKHGNISVYSGDKRSAFVLFSAAGLFRWVHNGMQSDRE
ncbi:hypothetical protein BDZ89DRAFT_905802, partial [Hymenopellis radicata]